MNAILSQRGIIIPKVDIEQYFGNDMQKLLTKMTIKTRVKVGPPKVAKLYKYEWEEGEIIRNGKIIKLKSQVIHIPRGYLKNMVATGVIKHADIMLPPGKILSPASATFAAELENNQNVVVERLMQDVFTPTQAANGTACCTLNLGAGRGKTFIAASIISKISRAALYFIPNSSILSQTMEAMKICLPNAVVEFYGDVKDSSLSAAKKLYRVHSAAAKTKTSANANPLAIASMVTANAEKKEWIANKYHQLMLERMKSIDVCVVIINSAMMLDEDFFANFGLMIFDEVHEYCGKERAKVFWKCQAPYMLGMSATTDEHMYGWDKVYYMHVGEVIHAKAMPGYDPDEVKFKGSVKIIKYHGPPGFTENKISPATGMLFAPDMHLQAMNDTCRNMLIICEILLLYLDTQCERNIFVFFERREHVQRIVNMMRNKEVLRLAARILSAEPYRIQTPNNIEAEGDELVFAPEIDMMRGGSKQEEIYRAMKSRIIVTTYGYSKTGVSIIRMNSLIIGTSRKSKFKQTLARSMRLRSDYSIERKFVDIVDWDTAIKAQHYERRKAYAFYEFTLSSVDISWELFKDVADLASLQEYTADTEPTILPLALS